MRTRLVLLLIVIVTLAGCAQVPNSGPVRAGDEAVVGKGQGQVLSVRPGPPRPGISPLQLIQGYLVALEADDPAKQVARSYLTAEAAATWDPTERAVVYDGTRVSNFLRPAGQGTYVLRAPKVGQLDPRGAWTSADDPAFSATFRVSREGGQWRISQAPDGILLTREWLQRKYIAYNLYFFDPTQTVLVADPIYIARTGQEATQLIRGLLAGPTSQLGPSGSSVLNLAPEGTTLNVSVPIDANGVADVPLNSQPLALSPDQRNLFVAQVVWTLHQLPEITGVRITVDGARFEVPDSGDVIPIDRYAGFNPASGAVTSLYALNSAGAPVLVNVNSPERPEVIGSLQYAATALAMNSTASQYAIVSRHDKSVLIYPMPAEAATPPDAKVLTHGDVLTPSYDLTGRLWLVDEAGTSARLRVRLPSGAVQPVNAPGLRGKVLRAFQVNRDGVRVLAVTSDRRGDTLWVGRVSTQAGRLTISSLTRMPAVEGGVASARWTGNQIAVLGQSVSGAAPLQLLSQDGSNRVQVAGDPALADATGVAASVDPTMPLVVTVADRSLYFQTPDQRWVRAGTGLTAATYPN